MRGIRFGLGPSLPSHDGPLKATRVLRMLPAKSTRVNKHMVESGHHSATKPTEVIGREIGEARYRRSNNFSPGFPIQAPTTRIRMFLKTTFCPPFQTTVHTKPEFLAIPTLDFEQDEMIMLSNCSVHSLQGRSIIALVVCLSAQLSIILLPLLL